MVAQGMDVAVVEYHLSDEYENIYSSTRANYYNISGIPDTYFDGVTHIVGGSSGTYNQYVNVYNNRIGVPTYHTVDIFGENTGGQNYSVDLILKEIDPYTANDLRAHLILTESDVNGYNYVCRLMVPDQFGTSIDFSNGNQIHLELDFTLNGSWDPDECELVAIIQNHTTKEVLQADKVWLNNLVPFVDPLSSNFYVSDTTPCPGIPVQFFQDATGNPNSYYWEFEGGIPATSNEENPMVYFETPGDWDVSLMVSTGFESQTTTKEDFMNVQGTAAIFDPVDDQCVQYPAFELTQGIPAGGTYEGPGVEDGWFDPEVAGVGTHTLSYIYDDGTCVDTAFQTVFVDICEGIADYSEAQMNVFPNPTEGSFRISMSNMGVKDASIEVFDALGKIVFAANGIELSGNKEQVIDLSDQMEGIYFVRLQAGDYSVYQKLVLKR